MDDYPSLKFIFFKFTAGGHGTDLPKCYAIIRSDSFQLKTKLSDQKIRDSIVEKIKSRLKPKIKETKLHLHLTTDDRKTNIRVHFYKLNKLLYS